MSEKVPEPEVPVSSRKLSDSPFESCVSESSEEYDSFEEAKGYRIVSMDSLRKFIQRIHGPCASGKKLYKITHITCLFYLANYFLKQLYIYIILRYVSFFFYR